MGRIQDRGITFRFLIYFSLIVVLPIMVINVFSVRAYRRMVVENAIALISQQQASVARNLDKELKTYNRILAAVVYNSKSAVLDHATNIHRASDLKDKYDLTESMDEKIRLIMYAGGNIDGLYFLFDDDGYYYYNNPLSAEVTFVKELQIYKEAISNPDKTQIGPLLRGLTTDSDGRYTMLFGVHPSISDYRSDVDIVLLSAFTDVLSDEALSRDDSIGSVMYIVDDKGVIMYSKDSLLEGRKIAELEGLEEVMTTKTYSFLSKIQGEETLVNVHQMKDVGWRIVNLVSQSYVTRQADRVTAISMYINLGMICCFMIFSVFFFRGILGPVNTLVHGMKHIERGELGYRLAPVGSGELRRLAISFNVMAIRLSRLISDNQKKEWEKMQAEMDALQSQINPHFIVNSLSTIKFMAMVSKNHNIQKMSEILMRILNTAFRHRGHFNTLEQEVELVRSYIEIMLIRYGNDFEVRYDIDDALLEVRILKLILQPIVENSITHGLSEKDGHKVLLIRVRGEKEKLIVEVIDNGIGMKKDQLASAFEQKEDERKHIGISNIQNRIRLNHGPDYGLTLESRPGYYMKTIMTLPLVVEGDRDDQSDFGR